MSSMLLIHIVIALASIGAAAYAALRPSRRLLRASYLLIGGTLGTGSYLVLQDQTHLGSACAAGLLYLAIVTAATMAAHLKLARTPSA